MDILLVIYEYIIGNISILFMNTRIYYVCTYFRLALALLNSVFISSKLCLGVGFLNSTSMVCLGVGFLNSTSMVCLGVGFLNSTSMVCLGVGFLNSTSMVCVHFLPSLIIPLICFLINSLIKFLDF